MGLFDIITDPLFGDAPEAKASGAFPGLDELGGEFQQFLLDRLRTPVEETDQFRRGAATIRDTSTRQQATARQRLGDSATSRGFLDSGALIDANVGIARSGAALEQQSLTRLLMALEDRREQSVLPFLSGGAQESLGVQRLNMESELARDSLQFDALRATGAFGAAGDALGFA